jgi:energy-coupling factor transporter ATP-binding protein EcfA2
MRLARLELREIGPFEDAVFEIPEPEGPGELVIFEGPNGSGKTTIAEAIACVSDSPGWGEAPHEQFGRRFRFRHRSVLSVRFEQGDWWMVSKHSLVPGVAGRESSDVAKWSAPLVFAYAGHQATPVVATKGPTEIETPPLKGALSFGAVDPASAHFGQLLVNLDQEVAKAFREAHRDGIPAERRLELDRLVASRQKMLDDIARALSEALARKVTFEVPVGQHAPTISVDGEPVPLDLLGEGMRSTFAWLSDLLVRLHRIPWEDAARSPLEQDFWLILDEVDESLHPTMQARLLPVLRGLFPNARIYATTHSPFFIASAGRGVVFPIRPDKDHKVRGTVAPRALLPGQSLEWVTHEIFQAQTGFVDPQTVSDLEDHDRDIRRYFRKQTIDWDAFLARRDRLWALNDEVRAAVAMAEVRMRAEIEREVRARTIPSTAAHTRFASVRRA